MIAVCQLKQKFNALQNSNAALFLTGVNGSGRKIWASYLSELSHPNVAMQILDSVSGISQSMPLKANLYIEEIADLDKDQQLRLCDAIQHDNSDSRYRFILSSRFDYPELVDNKEIISVVAESVQKSLLPIKLVNSKMKSILDNGHRH